MAKSHLAKPATCPNCGGNEFDWGWIHQRGFNRSVLFSKRNEGWIFGWIGRPIQARRCVDCEHIAFFCDPTRGPWPRFSLRAMLVVTTIVAILAALITMAARGVR